MKANLFAIPYRLLQTKGFMSESKKNASETMKGMGFSGLEAGLYVANLF